MPQPQKEKSSRSGTNTTSIQNGHSKQQRGPMYKGRPIGSPPPIPAPPLPQQHINNLKPQSHPPPPPPPSSHPYHHQQPPPSLTPSSPSGDIPDCSGEVTDMEPDYGTIKGSPSPPRKEQGASGSPAPSLVSPTPQQRHHQLITMKQSIVPYGKHQSLILRDSEGRKATPRGGAWKGSIRSEIHKVELITTDVRSGGGGGDDKPVFDYGSFIRRRLYYSERGSRLDQKSERTGNYCGPWYDLWGEDPSVSVP